MRWALLIVAWSILAACASEKLALAPPAGVDFSGHWRFNAADSDDPQRLLQARAARGGAGERGGGGDGDADERGRQGGGRSARGLVPDAPPPPVSVLGEAMAWPGPDIMVRQTGGTVTFASSGVNRVYRPSAIDQRQRQRDAREDPNHGRDIPLRARGEAPPLCGWDARILVVLSDDPDEGRAPFERRFELSEDGRRLIEVVAFATGLGSEYTVSRVWDRVGP